MNSFMRVCSELEKAITRLQVQTLAAVTIKASLCWQVILPSRTLSSAMKLLKKEQQITSDGYLAWDDRANSKVFYSLQLNDGSQYYRKVGCRHYCSSC